MTDDRYRWDERYRHGTGPGAPSPFLIDCLRHLSPGRALDVACGTGANLLACAEHGWSAVGVDVSPVALRLVGMAARERRLDVSLVAADVSTFVFPRHRFDLVGVFRFLHRALVPSLIATLRPGGTLVYETFTTAQRDLAGGPRSSAFLLESGELPRLFDALAVVDYREGVWTDGGRPEALARFVGRKQ